jgi:pimeloyl-ACP methyl ester carboxylesterase
MPDKPSRSHFGREARAFVVTWSAALATGCTMPGPKSDKNDMRSLERVGYSTQDGLRLSYLRSGTPDGPRIIYVHGSPSDAYAFADELVDAEPGFESVSIDRPGYGHAKHTGTIGSFQAQAAALEPLLLQRDGRWPILVGHSLGGPIIARAAADYPGRVGGLVIVAGSLDPTLEKPRWFNHAAGVPPVRWILPGLLRVSNDEMMAAPVQTRLLAEVLGRVRCPVVIVHGTRDGLVPYANVHYMERTFVNARSVRTITLPDEGHFMVWNQQGRAAIRGAVRELAGQPASAQPATDQPITTHPAASGATDPRTDP